MTASFAVKLFFRPSRAPLCLLLLSLRYVFVSSVTFEANTSTTPSNVDTGGNLRRSNRANHHPHSVLAGSVNVIDSDMLSKENEHRSLGGCKETGIYLRMGCDQIDNDCDNGVDDCEEDLIPPTIFIKKEVSHNTTTLEDFQFHILKDVCFDDIGTARQFLLSNIVVADDCSPEVDLSVEYISQYSDTGLATFEAIATDTRCHGVGGNTMHTEFFRVEMFDGFDTQGLLSDPTIVQGMGCDGRYQNCDGIIDDCLEDLVPPEISFNVSHPIVVTQDSDNIVVDQPRFKTIEEARTFLFNNVRVADDCAKDLTIEVTSPSAVCGGTSFEVTVRDPRCSDVNPIQTVMKTFILHVDEESPTVNAGFLRAPEQFHYDSENLYLHVNEVNLDSFNPLLNFTIHDNCPQNLKVEIKISSNQNEPFKKIATVTRREDLHQSRQAQVYIKPQVCGGKFLSVTSICEGDPSGFEPRFYEINVSATDFAGNVGFNNVTVIVIPEKHLTETNKGSQKHVANNFILKAWEDHTRYHILNFQTEYDTSIPTE